MNAEADEATELKRVLNLGSSGLSISATPFRSIIQVFAESGGQASWNVREIGPPKLQAGRLLKVAAAERHSSYSPPSRHKAAAGRSA